MKKNFFNYFAKACVAYEYMMGLDVDHLYFINEK